MQSARPPVMGHDEGGGDESRQGGFSFQGGGDADLMEQTRRLIEEVIPRAEA